MQYADHFEQPTYFYFMRSNDFRGWFPSRHTPRCTSLHEQLWMVYVLYEFRNIGVGVVSGPAFLVL